jgi:hypothetical protein
MWWQYTIVFAAITAAVFVLARRILSRRAKTCGAGSCACAGAGTKPDPFADRLGSRQPVVTLRASASTDSGSRENSRC